MKSNGGLMVYFGGFTERMIEGCQSDYNCRSRHSALRQAIEQLEVSSKPSGQSICPLYQPFQLVFMIYVNHETSI
ncbi:MAG: hypothetical protein WCA64_05980 [Gallionella sp.]